jgi:hypothetical protein
MKHITRSFLVFTLTFLCASLAAAWLFVTLPGLYYRLRLRLASEPLLAPDTAAILSFLLSFAACLVIGLLAAYVTVRRLNRLDTPQPRRRWHFPLEALTRALEGLLLISFVATWALGVPAVVSHLHKEALAAHQSLVAHGPPPHFPRNHSYPYINTPLAFPVAPGFVLSYHEYQIAPLAGAGLIQVHFWCGLEPFPVYMAIPWLS